MSEDDRRRVTLSLHGDLLQWINNTNSGAFRLPGEHVEEHVEEHERCAWCGCPSLAELVASLVQELGTISLHADLLEGVNDAGSSGFRLPAEHEELAEEHKRCPRCGCLTLEQGVEWFAEYLQAEFFYPDGAPRL